MKENIIFIVLGWIVCMLIGFWMRAQSRDRLTVADLVFAIVFGPLYALTGFDSWDKPIWKRNKKE